MQRQGVTQGVIYLSIAQMVFVLSGYMIHIGLGRSLGPCGYGIYSIIIYLITLFNLVLTTGVPNAASKYISEDESKSYNILKSSSYISFFISLVLVVIVYFGAEDIAIFFKDQALEPYVKVSSLMLLIYPTFTIVLGYYNGMRDYKMESYLIIIYNINKPLIIFFLIFMGYSAWGAVLGFAISPLVPLVLGIYYINIKNILKSDMFSFRKLIFFAGPIIMFSFAMNLIMSLDLLFVKRILTSNELVGYYSAASMISRVPFSLMGAITIALFPAVSAVTENPLKIREYICESVRYTLLFIFPIIAIVASSSDQLVSLLYSDAYWPAGGPLRILIIGISLLSVFAVLTTIISGTGKPGISMLLGILVLVIDYFLNITLIPEWGMVGAAAATTISITIGVVAAAIYIYVKYDVITSVLSGVKIFLATIFIYFIFSNISLGGVYLLIGYFFMGFIYILILICINEIKGKDIERIKRFL